MALILPFRALRPAAPATSSVASVPYDVVSTEEARALASGAPLSFLHVTRSEIDLPPGTNPYSEAVYAQAERNFEELKRAAPMTLDDEPSLYIYRLQMGAHEQTGIAGCFSVDEYERGLIKKHEKTRKEKEDDRTRHVVETRAQTGVVFLTYKAAASLDQTVAALTRRTPLYYITAPDGVVHTIWQVTGPDVDRIVRAFEALPALYIAQEQEGWLTTPATSSGATGDLSAPVNICDSCATQLEGYVTAPVSGGYTFWLASDDEGALWLSSDDRDTERSCKPPSTKLTTSLRRSGGRMKSGFAS